MTREEKLIILYKNCLRDNYTDMSDETHQLKAKVFAMDLKLKYKNISDLYNEAKAAYEKSEIEKQMRNVAAESKAKKEAAAKVAFTINNDSDDSIVDVYMCDDGSTFCRERSTEENPYKGEIKYSDFEITVEAGKLFIYKYHPSKTIYTGATVGGVSMGGFHNTEAYYTADGTKTEKGQVVILYGGKKVIADSVIVSNEIGNLFKRIPEYYENFKNNTAVCKNKNADTSYLEVAPHVKNETTLMYMLSKANDDMKLPYKNCAAIATILNRIVHNDFPETDEQIYLRAVAISQAEDITNMKNAHGLFVHIADYKDARERAKILSEKINEITQLEKEKKVIKKEARSKKNKLIAAIGATVIAIALVLVIVMKTVIIPDDKYSTAIALMENKEYTDALSAFSELGNYKDSKSHYSSIMSEIAVKETIIAHSYNTFGLKSDGTVVAVGDNDCGQCDISDWTDIIAISAGSGHTVGLKADGTVVATEYMGNTTFYMGQCDVSDWTDIVAISAGSSHTVGLKSDGTVVATEYTGTTAYYKGECDVSDWTDIIAVSAGSVHTVGLKADGTVVSTEYLGDTVFYRGQCDVSEWTDIVAICASSGHTVGLKSDGTVIAVGDNEYGQCDVSDWTDIVAISAGSSHTVGLKSDGTVVSTEYLGDTVFYRGQCDVSEWTDIVAISAGDYHTVGIKSDGTVVVTEHYGERTIEMGSDGKIDITEYNGEHNKGQHDVTDWNNIKVYEKKY